MIFVPLSVFHAASFIWLISTLLAVVNANSLEGHYIVAFKTTITPADAEKHIHTVRDLHQESMQSQNVKYRSYAGVKAHYRKLNMYALHTTDEVIRHLREHFSHHIEHIGPDAEMPKATLEDDIRDGIYRVDYAADDAFEKALIRDPEDRSYHVEESFGSRLYMDIKKISTESGALKVTNIATYHQARIAHRTLAATKRFAPGYSYAYWAPKSVATPVVYVLDSGVVIDHPEFEGRVTHGETLDTTGPGDRDGHGTACMSRAIGKFLGTAPNALGVSIKTLHDNTGNTTLTAFLAAMDYVVRQPILHFLKVVSISIGVQPEPLEPGQRFHFAQLAVDRLNRFGVHIVWAAGNEGLGVRSYVTAQNSDGLLLVGSVNNRDERSFFSNYGPRIRIAAPGEEVVVATPRSKSESGYALQSGTSLSAPMVAGVMLQTLATYGPMEPWELRELLMSWTTVEATGIPPGMPMRILYNNSGM